MYNFAYLIAKLSEMPLIEYVSAGFAFASIFNAFWRWIS